MPHILEILPRGCSKGRGVEELLMHLEIDEESCIAFGDAENDIEMLEFVGTGFSVANALPSVTDAADASTLSNDDDGVAAVLAKVVKAEPTFSDSGAVSDGFGLELALGLAEKGGLVSGDGVDINQLVLDEAAAQEELKEALELLELQKSLAEELGYASAEELQQAMEEIEQQEGGLEAFLSQIEAEADEKDEEA
mmetsp:Transcript_72905/g.207703  ORF Transcript_72905/g.207703 Transcript_72905/m.207703 type:complete len:195 (+) Transcript_72905:746-1330(+)